VRIPMDRLIGCLTRQPMSYKNDSMEPSVRPRSCFSALYGRSRVSLREVHIAMDLSCNTTPSQFHLPKALCRISTCRRLHPHSCLCDTLHGIDENTASR
jgi:hypothetical protein